MSGFALPRLVHKVLFQTWLNCPKIIAAVHFDPLQKIVRKIIGEIVLIPRQLSPLFAPMQPCPGRLSEILSTVTHMSTWIIRKIIPVTPMSQNITPRGQKIIPRVRGHKITKSVDNFLIIFQQPPKWHGFII